MKHRARSVSDEVAEARLALVSEGKKPLGAARRALDELTMPEDDAPIKGWRAKIRLSRSHLLALLLIGLALVGIFAVNLAGARTVEAVPIGTPPVSVSAKPYSPEPSHPPKLLRVHVLGAVQKPGVYSLLEGAIVADAIKEAGGMAEGAVPGELNLAAPIADGLQVRVGTTESDSRTSAATSKGSGSLKERVNINTATAEELDQLPGIGPATASAIVQWREEHGKFSSLDQLQEISGIGAKTVAKLTPHVTL
ncbi:helix-hairpin-helix domain-containing protein [Tessaracoccus sp. OH4464_COT-324]|uniref:helix-hairpin-helix domain-containing protein n=1 Tax=Tessaracoccus sp. OH4464_COT-324 TaxID=2491059 RepID=UPI000F62EC4A|nr:helix-hairpin-helix domain-containing protein [Tessaracoccus sp. OH4464_COT-324]RRD47787.1 competence protein ComE [Tessaracoccus sp. OH4464_COT-324]